MAQNIKKALKIRLYWSGLRVIHKIAGNLFKWGFSFVLPYFIGFFVVVYSGLSCQKRTSSLPQICHIFAVPATKLAQKKIAVKVYLEHYLCVYNRSYTNRQSWLFSQLHIVQLYYSIKKGVRPRSYDP